jgi:hypothetical protein
LSLPGADVGIEIEKALSAVLNLNYLQNCIAQEGKFINKINIHVRTITDEGNDLLTPADYFGWFDRLKKGVF